MYTRSFRRLIAPLVIGAALPLAALAQQSPTMPLAPSANPDASVVHKIQLPSERLEMTVHTSRILTLERKIAQAQVNNPTLMDLTPLSPHQIQVSAKAAGVTQINLWGDDQKLSTIDVIIFGDVRELQMILQTSFPNAALKVTPVSNSVMISGFVDQPEHIERIIRIAEEYYPKVINNMTVGGCQQVLLHVKVMEVSRTKLRKLGFDFAKVTGSSVAGSGVSGLLSNSLNTSQSLATTVRSGTANTFSFGVVDGTSAFFGFLDALRRDNLLKILSDPTLVTISGRAAVFNAGGEIPVPVPQSLGTISIEWKQYGTQIKFIPIVLGNGKIRLEVVPYISELDESRSTTINGTKVPGIRSRTADTGVEMTAGQTLAIAGLVQTRIEAENSGLPWISELPYVGVPFRKVNETVNEVELLMLVTPELVEAMDADEVPPCGPGMQTTSPSDCELFLKGHLEVPKCCPGDCGDCRNQRADCLPPEGMIQNPGEKIPTPPAAEGASAVRPRSRYNSSNPTAQATAKSADSSNNPPGFIGPVGYDVVQ